MGNNLAEMNVKAMPEHQGLAGLKCLLIDGLIQRPLSLIRHKHHDHLGLGSGFLHG